MGRSIAKRFKRELKSAGLIGKLDMTDEQLARVEAAQLANVSELSNVSILACLLNVMVLVLSFYQTTMGGAVFLWGGIMCVVLGYMAFSTYRRRVNSLKSDGQDTKQHLDAFIRANTILGILWGLIALIVIPFSDSIGLTASGMLLVGTMFGGVLLIGRIPDAAMGLVVPIIMGVLVGLQIQQDPRNTLLSIMALSYMGVLYFASRLAYTQFAQQQLGQYSMEEQTEVISLLLKDFEDTTKDWLWQTDIRGVIAPRLLNQDVHAEIDNRMPIGDALLDLFVPSPEKADLEKAIIERRPFRDVTLQLEDDAAIQWWRFSGKPVFAKGEFVGFRGVACDVTNAKQAEDRIIFMAHFDALTRLPNRETLTANLRALSQRSEIGALNHALIWLDLDNFKWVNDTMGHHAGDEVLQKLGERIQAEVGEDGILARISGDEFAMVLPFTDATKLNGMLDDVCDRLAAPYKMWGSTIQCRATMGVKILPQSNSDVDVVLKHADMALYSAKGQQKGTWSIFDQSLEDRAQSQRQLETDLNQAIERNELRLFFQPLVDAKSKEIVGCETLLRWQHPSKGLLSPDAFIEFAEDTGNINRIGDWVLRQALSEARALPDDMRIAINISPLQLHSESLVPTIVNALGANGIAPHRLELEITESVMMTDTEYTMDKLRQLKDIGVRIALDDFGTGFSSLSYLRQAPFDKLKIDKSFTEDLETSEDSRAITKATLQLAKALGMRVTGEGVETQSQADFLTDNGCDELQGFMISRPKPLANLGHLIDLQPMDAIDEPVEPARLKRAKRKPAADRDLRIVKKA